MPKGKPLAGDRAVWDADGYPLLHTNDADAAADALHHTLGTGANQAAAGNHTHTSSQVGLGNVANILCKFDATAEPTANDDSADGYAVGSSWFDVTNDKAYLCLDATVGAAVWQEVGGGGTDGTLASLSDVDIAGAANGERLTYNSTSEKWEPVAPTAGDGDMIGPVSAVDGHLAVFDGTTGKLLKDGGGIPSGSGAYICLQDQKTQGTAGGTFTSGAWRTRALNTELADTGNNASLSSNQITLSAGSYRCRVTCPAAYVERHQARLYNVTDGATILVGTSARTQGSLGRITQNNSEIVGRFTLAVEKTIEVQHICESSRSDDGFGEYSNFSTEIFTVAEFWKE